MERGIAGVTSLARLSEKDEAHAEKRHQSNEQKTEGQASSSVFAQRSR